MYPTPVSSVWSRDRPSVAVKLRLFYKISNFELAGNEKWRRRYPTPAAEDTSFVFCPENFQLDVDE